MRKKRDYKKTELRHKRQYERHEGDMLDYLRRHNPKQFHKYFAKRRTKTSNDISLNQFVDHFRDLGSIDYDEMNDDDDDDNVHFSPAAYDELDVEISDNEVENAISYLKRNTSCGEDCLINELFKDCKDVLLPYLSKLFNSIFVSGYFPESWSKGCIVPVYKKGDINDTNNYRGITLVSCLGKLFTSILNRRLLEWDKKFNIITDAQFGFRPGNSTVDAIFVLQSLINKTLKKRGGRLYCCFVDYRKAFDLIDRSKLWGKLIKQGINGKMIKIIYSLYENVKSCVKHNGVLSEYFKNDIGLFQGEVLSPILYSLYVNDCEMYFLKEHCMSFEINMINLFLLMYADDMCLFAQSPSDLQNMLNTLHAYNDEWNLTLNVQKTKIVIFRNGGIIRENEKWFYNGQQIEVVNQFKYLGMLFNFNGKHNITQKHVAEQGRKAYFALNSKFKNHHFNIISKCSVFDTYVKSILSYGAEIWGFHKATDVESVHTKFCKNILGVKKSTCNNFVYYELGRFPLNITRKLQIIKYWIKLKKSENIIIKSCLEDRENYDDDWLKNIKLELNHLGLGYIWEMEQIDAKLIKEIEQRFHDVHAQEIFTAIQNVSRGENYKYLADNFGTQHYLTKSINELHRKCITRIRLSSHNLNIETGRYRHESRTDRRCTLCDLDDLEDEFHFILKCPFYNDLRVTLIKPYYLRRTSVFKLIELLSTRNLKELRNLGRFLYLADKRRNCHTN